MALYSFAIMMISLLAMTFASEVSFTSVMTSLSLIHIFHRALQPDAADGGDAALQAHGDAHVAELEAVAGAQTALFPAPLQLRVVADDVDEAADARHRLTEHGGEGRAEGPHPEDEDAEQVEADVQHAGHQQEVQRPLAVAQRTHEGLSLIHILPSCCSWRQRSCPPA